MKNIPVAADVSLDKIEIIREILLNYNNIKSFNYLWPVKKIDKLKKQRYEVSMKIISFESKAKIKKLSKNEEKEFEIIQELEKNLDKKIEELRVK